MQLPAFKRDTTITIVQRLKENRNFIQVLSGPRQVGKTTAIRQVLEEIDIPYHYASADLPAPPPVEWIGQQWDLGRSKVANEESAILVLDEIQKISNWSAEVKRLWDEDTRHNLSLKVIILGSSALLMKKGLTPLEKAADFNRRLSQLKADGGLKPPSALTESLAGRFEIIRLTHWSWKECRNCFKWDIDKFIYFGGYPGAASLIDNEERWAQYVKDSLIETAVSKDILLLNRVEKPALLRQLFVLACEYGGQILSYQKLLGQLADAGNTVTLAHYQKLLESAFLIKGLEKWSGGVLRRRSSSPKWLPLNTALVTALANKSFQEWRANPDMWGRLVEVSVGAHLVNEGTQHGIELYYWRRGNNEVDFILSKGGVLVAIEVKSGKKRVNIPGLIMFTKKYKTKRAITVGQTGIAIEEFFETPILEWFK